MYYFKTNVRHVYQFIKPPSEWTITIVNSGNEIKKETYKEANVKLIIVMIIVKINISYISTSWVLDSSARQIKVDSLINGKHGILSYFDRWFISQSPWCSLLSKVPWYLHTELTAEGIFYKYFIFYN